MVQNESTLCRINYIAGLALFGFVAHILLWLHEFLQIFQSWMMSILHKIHDMTCLALFGIVALYSCDHMNFSGFLQIFWSFFISWKHIYTACKRELSNAYINISVSICQLTNSLSCSDFRTPTIPLFIDRIVSKSLSEQSWKIWCLCFQTITIVWDIPRYQMLIVGCHSHHSADIKRFHHWWTTGLAAQRVNGLEMNIMRVRGSKEGMM